MSWPGFLMKKVYRYLLHRYLGQFLEQKLTLEQLKVDLFQGTGTIADLTLCAKVSEILHMCVLILSSVCVSFCTCETTTHFDYYWIRMSRLL